MEINIKPNISFQSLKIINSDGLKLFKGFKCRDRNSQLYNVNINKVAELRYEISAKPLNTHTPVSAADIRFNEDSINLDLISTNISKQKQGLGTILNLANIIEMLENNLGSVNLFATATALPFHAKFGFYPTEMWEEGLYNNMVKLAKQKNPLYKDYSKRAAVLLSRDIPFPEKSAIGNKIMYDYLQKILSQKNKLELLDEFEYGSDMVLDKNMIIANKNYYNNLLKKHCIDYEI